MDDASPYRVCGSRQDNRAISVPGATVDGADFAPPQGAREVYAELCDKLAEYAAAVAGLMV